MNFKYKEITHSDTARRLNMKNDVPLDLMDNMILSAHNMQKIRDLLGKPIIINSWFRTENLNEILGGVKNSHHKDCLAIDFVASGMSISDAYKKITESNIKYDQLILYKNKGFIHISFSKSLRMQKIEK
ncbi:MAG: D-Ala-D-Ala carboxypeptidase family metallohydrolase [Cetobacterium sp.]